MSNWDQAVSALTPERLDELSTAIQHIRHAQAHLILAEPALKDLPVIWAEFQAAQQVLYDLVDPRSGELKRLPYFCLIPARPPMSRCRWRPLIIG
jgi:hypothetical protein